MKHDDRSYRAVAREAMEARFARSVAACLTESADQVSPDVAERLRFGREKALEASRRARGNAQSLGVTASGAAIAGFSETGKARPRSRLPPRSTRPCWATTCRSMPIAIRASRSS